MHMKKSITIICVILIVCFMFRMDVIGKETVTIRGDACESYSSQSAAQNTSTSDGVTAHTVAANEWGILNTGSTKVTISGPDGNGTTINNPAGFASPLDFSNGRVSTNANYAPTGDTNFDITSDNGDGSFEINASNQFTYDYYDQLAIATGFGHQGGYSENDIKEMTKLASEQGIEMSITYEPVISLRDGNGVVHNLTISEIEKNHPELFNDPTVGAVLRKVRDNICDGGVCTAENPSKYGCIKCDDEKDECPLPPCNNPEDDNPSTPSDDVDDDTPSEPEPDEPERDPIEICTSNCEPTWKELKLTGGSCSMSSGPSCPGAREITRVEDKSSGGTCENPTYINLHHDYIDVACGYATIDQLVTTTINYPNAPKSPIIAGESFLWGKATSNQKIEVIEINDSKYINTKCSVESSISSNQSYVQCLMAGVELMKSYIATIRADLDNKESGTCVETYEVCNYTDYDTCHDYYNTTAPCDCHSEKRVNAACEAAMIANIASLEQSISQSENAIETTNQVLLQLSEQLAEVIRCGDEISNYSKYEYSENDVVTFYDSKMEIANTDITGANAQMANSIVAIEKNSGNLLKETDLLNFNGKYISLPGGVNTDKNHYFQFTIPATIKDGSRGIVSLKTTPAVISFAGNRYGINSQYSDTSKINASISYTKYISQLTAEDRMKMYSSNTDPNIYNFYAMITTKNAEGEYELYNKFKDDFCDNYGDYFFKIYYYNCYGNVSYDDNYKSNYSNLPLYCTNLQDRYDDNSFNSRYNSYHCYRSNYYYDEDERNALAAYDYSKSTYCKKKLDNILFSEKNVNGTMMRNVKATYDKNGNPTGAAKFYDIFSNLGTCTYNQFHSYYSNESPYTRNSFEIMSTILEKVVGNKLKSVAATFDGIPGTNDYTKGYGKPIGTTLAGQYMNPAVTYSIETPDEYSCEFDVFNPYICTNLSCDEDGKINLIYRQISLENPFPNSGNTGLREMGPNWSKELVDSIITNNRDVETNEVYNLEPLYTITLTPQMISRIRNDYDNISLNDFNLSCDKDGQYCISSFVHNYLDELGAIDKDNSCAYNTTHASDWYNCYKNN